MAGLNMRTKMASKKPAKELDHIRVAEAENGGHTAHHHFTAEYEHPPEGPHIFPAHGEKVPVVEGHLFHHLAKHLGIPHEVMGKEEPEGEHEMEEEEMEA
jgi:hypothetical protein